VLTQTGWSVQKVMAYGDLAWVNEAWWPLVKSELRAWERESSHSRSVAT
jgi:hypothetical protein